MAEKDTMHLSMGEAPSTSVFHWGTPKRNDQPTAVKNALVDEHVPSHQ